MVRILSKNYLEKGTELKLNVGGKIWYMLIESKSISDSYVIKCAERQLLKVVELR